MEKICMIQQIICEKKRFFSRGPGRPQITRSPRCAGQWCVTGLPGVTAPTIYTFSFDSMPLHCLTCGGD